MRITAKGQVTIPQHIREELGLLPHTEVDFIVEAGEARIVKIERPGAGSRGDHVLRRLRGRATVSMSTDEILGLTRDA